MERKEVIDFFDSIELEYPVYEWKYGDIDIWPFIKQMTFFSWFNPTAYKVDVAKEKEKRIEKMKRFVFLLLSLIKWTFKRKREIDYLFIDANTYRVDFEGKYINKFYYPLISGLDTSNFQAINYQDRKNKNYDNTANLYFLKDLEFLSFFSIKSKTKPQFFVPEWEEVINVITSKLKIENNVKKTFDFHSERLDQYLIIYEKFIKKFRPKKVYALCYYGPKVFSINYLCNKLGVECVDVQHGSQGKLHPFYHFNNFPSKGLNVLPKTFWCWDKASANNIKNWLPENSFHNVEVGGNLWIDFIVNNSGEWKHEKNIILYTLQQHYLDDYILETIKLTSSKYSWWIRMHPRMMDAKENITNQLKQFDLNDKVEITKASSLPLPLILNNSLIHLSRFSGSIIEATQLGIKTILLDPIGVETYSEYVKSGDAIPLLDQDESILTDLIIETITKSKLEQ